MFPEIPTVASRSPLSCVGELVDIPSVPSTHLRYDLVGIFVVRRGLVHTAGMRALGGTVVKLTPDFVIMTLDDLSSFFAFKVMIDGELSSTTSQ